MGTSSKDQDGSAASQPDPQEGQPVEGASGCLLRVYWMLLGNALVFLCAYLIAQAGGLFSAVDVFYWLAVAGLLGARYVDVRYMNGRTAEGQPATTRDWRRYRLGVLGVSVVLWGAVHLVGLAAW
jgi:hypothetical protein